MYEAKVLSSRSSSFPKVTIQLETFHLKFSFLIDAFYQNIAISSRSGIRCKGSFPQIITEIFKPVWINFNILRPKLGTFNVPIWQTQFSKSKLGNLEATYGNTAITVIILYEGTEIAMIFFSSFPKPLSGKLYEWNLNGFKFNINFYWANSTRWCLSSSGYFVCFNIWKGV